MYEGVRDVLAADDALRGRGEEPRFRVRETPDWKKHAADLESEMLKRGMIFEVIDWAEIPGKRLSSDERRSTCRECRSCGMARAVAGPGLRSPV